MATLWGTIEKEGRKWESPGRSVSITAEVAGRLRVHHGKQFLHHLSHPKNGRSETSHQLLVLSISWVGESFRDPIQDGSQNGAHTSSVLIFNGGSQLPKDLSALLGLGHALGELDMLEWDLEAVFESVTAQDAVTALAEFDGALRS